MSLKLRVFSGLREQQTTLNTTDVTCSLPPSGLFQEKFKLRWQLLKTLLYCSDMLFGGSRNHPPFFEYEF